MAKRISELIANGFSKIHWNQIQILVTEHSINVIGVAINVNPHAVGLRSNPCNVTAEKCSFQHCGKVIAIATPKEVPNGCAFCIRFVSPYFIDEIQHFVDLCHTTPSFRARCAASSSDAILSARSSSDAYT